MKIYGFRKWFFSPISRNLVLEELKIYKKNQSSRNTSAEQPLFGGSERRQRIECHMHKNGGWLMKRGR